MTDGTREVESLEIGPETRDRVAGIARRHGVRLLVAFGSQVSRRTHAASDLDLAVLLNTPHGDDPLRLLADLQAAFPEQEVDVVWLHRADPLIAWHALRQPRLLFGDPGDLTHRQAYAWRRFVEYAPFFELEADAVRRGIARFRRARR